MNFHGLKQRLLKSARWRLSVMQSLLRARPSRTRRQKANLLSANKLEPAKLALLEKVESLVSHKDGDHYFTVGLSAIECLDAALQRAKSTTVREILDLPCGYGRVLRFLVQRFPQARITACELMPDAVRFCAETFGAVPAQSSYNLDELSFTTKSDLIWCGSLITHLDANRTRALLRFFARKLAAEGLLVFSTHGEFVAAQVTDGADFYGLNRSGIPRLIRVIP